MATATVDVAAAAAPLSGVHSTPDAQPLGGAYASRLVVPDGVCRTTFGVAAHCTRASASLGDKFGSACSAVATIPAVKGVAMDVPVRVRVAVSEAIPAPTMLVPGATMSTHLPWKRVRSG